MIRDICYDVNFLVGGDFNEEITNINTTTRQQYVVEFMAEHQMYTKEMEPTFINAKGKDCTCLLSMCRFLILIYWFFLYFKVSSMG
jgi:hypothetical protein